MNDLTPPLGGLVATPDRMVIHYQNTLRVVTNEYNEDEDTYHVILARVGDDEPDNRIEMLGVPPETAAQFTVGSEWILDAALG